MVAVGFGIKWGREMGEEEIVKGQDDASGINLFVFLNDWIRGRAR